jgi:hypothetical protein
MPVRAVARRMKILGLLLLVSGWTIVLAAIALLPVGTPRVVFVFAGMGVELLGIVLFIHAHPLPRGDSRE